MGSALSKFDRVPRFLTPGSFHRRSLEIGSRLVALTLWYLGVPEPIKIAASQLFLAQKNESLVASECLRC